LVKGEKSSGLDDLGDLWKKWDQPLKWVILKNMSDEHIQAILDTQFHIGGFYRRHFNKELQLRKKYPKFSIKETK